MEQLERIEQLKERQKELFQHWKYMKQMVTFKLYELLNTLNLGPLPIYTEGDEIVEIDIPYSYGEKDVEWEVREYIYFKNDEGKRDFASDIEIYINNKRISVNTGTCGRWDLRDKGQWSRILLLKEIFYHEEDIIRELSKIVDVSEIDERRDISRELDQINRDIQKAEDERIKNEWIAKMKQAKYIAKLGSRYSYPTKEDGSVDYNGEPITLPRWYNIEEIEKVSEKTVLVHEYDYKWCHHRRDIANLVYELQHKKLYLVNDLNEFPPQEEGSK